MCLLVSLKVVGLCRVPSPSHQTVVRRTGVLGACCRLLSAAVGCCRLLSAVVSPPPFLCGSHCCCFAGFASVLTRHPFPCVPRFSQQKLERDWCLVACNADLACAPALHDESLLVPDGMRPKTPTPPPVTGLAPDDVHIGVSRRGSVVVYNTDAQEPVEDLLQVLESGSLSTPLPTLATNATEELSVLLNPALEEWSAFEGGDLVLKARDTCAPLSPLVSRVG